MTRAAPLALLLCAAAAAAEGEPSRAELLETIQQLTAEFQQYKEMRSQEIARLRDLVLARDEQGAPPTRRLQDAAGLPNVTDYLVQADLAGNMTEIRTALAEAQGAMDHMWLLLCGALVMFMQAGFAMLEAGCCREKNVQNIMMKNLTDVCAGTLCWWAFGWMFAYGGTNAETRFAGSSEAFGIGFMSSPTSGVITPSDSMRDWFFQWAFCSAAATIVSGGVAERVNFPGYLLYAIWMTSVIYPIVVAWTWSGNGILQRINAVGYMDFAGSGIVHMCGGVGALTGAIVVGPRGGRWDPNRQDEFAPHSLPLVVLGTFILWFGWYGFNCGSTLGLSDTATGQLAASVAMNTTISAATGGVTVLAVRLAIYKKYDVGGMCNGILAGLVSITAPCGNVHSGLAFLIGLVGALIYQGASMLLQKAGVDDPIDAFPVHGAAGMWGTLAAAIFDWGSPINIYHGWGGFACTTDADGKCLSGGRGQAFVANLVGILCIAAWTALLSAALLVPLKLGKLLRVNEEVEDRGMDAAKHSPNKAYSHSGEVHNIDISSSSVTKIVPTPP